MALLKARKELIGFACALMGTLKAPRMTRLGDMDEAAHGIHVGLLGLG
jgi:hypothetical protein